MPTLRKGAGSSRLAAHSGQPGILLDSESPYGSRRVVVEYDGATTAAYLHDADAIVGAAWIANHQQAPASTDLSRLDAGSLDLQTESVDLSELTRSVVHEFTPALVEHHTDLDVQLPQEGPEALCDRERVAQIVRILLDNALQHTPAGTHVSVRTYRRNGTADVTVADTGPGLPFESRAKVFERFYTGDATRGAGLGLAIARELAERMDGRLRVSAGSRGSVFTLELPADGNGAAE